MEDLKILELPLKAKWYEMIESGTKTEEYREVKPYWCNRLLGGCGYGVKDYWEPVLNRTFEAINELGTKYPNAYNLEHQLIWQYGTRAYTHIRFRYGYTNRTMLFALKNITIGKGNTEWGAPEDKDVFILKLGERTK